jgi:hypothetical protein
VDWATHTRRILAKLGEDATYTPSGGGDPSTVRGVYQQPHQEILGVYGGSDPSFACMQADVPTIKGGATFVIRGVTFKVKPAPESDPVSGLVLAKLEKQ